MKRMYQGQIVVARVEVSREIWLRIRAIAAGQGRKVSEIVQEALKQYIEKIE